MEPDRSHMLSRSRRGRRFISGRSISIWRRMGAKWWGKSAADRSGSGSCRQQANNEERDELWTGRTEASEHFRSDRAHRLITYNVTSVRVRVRRCWFDVGPASATLAQHQTSTGSVKVSRGQRSKELPHQTGVPLVASAQLFGYQVS